ncbi:MAG: bifunctional DNA-formamidopyrimidine glycosylase/DNA-(apurinic or apyrimidinic site) lyase [candidate division Zixibacteria bacterium]|nr:bifunctional DNA-formamidopyrimidine glycosylase/DNA-(apurinic or apyrimidinic site) lyase [candidate division Zixibacteria bacterium]
MPELPEVETIVRDMRSVLTGQSVLIAKFLNMSIKESGGPPDASSLRGKRLIAIDRRGKNIIFRFEKDLSMVIHLKMTGRLLFEKIQAEQEKHLHFQIEFSNNKLFFYDVRKFGRVGIYDSDGLARHPRLTKLGPEPFDLTPAQFARLLITRHKPIKAALIDQEIIAGIGNIYADESLFAAGIRPDRPSAKIKPDHLIRLHKSIIKVLKKAIDNRGSSVDDYLDGFGKSGKFQRLLKVYGRTGQKCLKCDATIKRITLRGRSTHYCPRCQK